MRSRESAFKAWEVNKIVACLDFPSPPRFLGSEAGVSEGLTHRSSFLPPPQETVSLYPFQIHSIALSTFASLIGPFGGFFASGFKRAFKIKVWFTFFAKLWFT